MSQIAYLLAPPEGGFVPLKRFLDPEDYKALVFNTALLQMTAQAESLLHDVVNRPLGQRPRGPRHQARAGRYAAFGRPAIS